MQRILHINTSKKGGAARIALELVKSFTIENSVKSVLAFGRGNASLADDMEYKASLTPEIYLHGCITRLIGLEGYGTYISTKRLIHFIEKNKFDIIHLHNIHGYYINFQGLIEHLKESRKNVVWTLHDCWPMAGSCAHPFDCKKYVTGCEKCNNIQAYPKNYFDNSAQMWRKKKNLLSDGWNPFIVTPSRWLADIVEASFLKDHRIEVIPNGIDVSVFQPHDRGVVRSELSMPKDGIIILFIAANLNDEQKGVKLFIDAVNRIGDIEKVTVVTAGQQLKSKLNSKYGLIEFGYVPDKNLLSKIYSSADVFCISSVCDSFPTTVLESMACGTPVVGFNVGGIPEQVADDCGILVPPKDVATLAEAIRYIISNEQVKNTMSRNCRNRALKNYSTKVMTNNYLNLYNSLLNNT